MELAKFNVLVNNKNITSDEAFDLVLSNNENTYNNKIAPNQNGYFEIEIDPTGTEVSLQYNFLFNLTDLDSEIKLTNYEINGNVYPIEDNIISGDLLLPSTGKAFTESDKLNIKINWEWTKEIVNPDVEETTDGIVVISTIKQKIN